MTEQSGKITVCPYWIKVFQSGEDILALCSREISEISSYTDDGIFSRMEKCPWYEEPLGSTILETYLDDLRKGAPEPRIVGGYNLSSLPEPLKSQMKTRLLSQEWDEAVEKFIQRHSQTR